MQTIDYVDRLATALVRNDPPPVDQLVHRVSVRRGLPVRYIERAFYLRFGCSPRDYRAQVSARLEQLDPINA